jgi:hypothetical protein
VRTGAATPDKAPFYCRVLTTLANPWDVGGPAEADETQQSRAAEAEKCAPSKRKRGRSARREVDVRRFCVSVVPQLPRSHVVPVV